MKFFHKDTGRLTWQAFALIVGTSFFGMSMIPFVKYEIPKIKKYINYQKVLHSPVVSVTGLSGASTEPFKDVSKALTPDILQDLISIKNTLKMDSETSLAVENMEAENSHNHENYIHFNKPFINRFSKQTEKDVLPPEVKIIQGKGSNIWRKGSIEVGTPSYTTYADYNIKDGDMIVINIKDKQNFDNYFIIKGEGQDYQNTHQHIYMKRVSDNDYNIKTIFSDGTSTVTIRKPYTEFLALSKNSNSVRTRNFYSKLLNYIHNDDKEVLMYYGNTFVESKNEFKDTDNVNNFIVSVIENKNNFEIYSKSE